jgi:hypothetical protein
LPERVFAKRQQYWLTSNHRNKAEYLTEKSSRCQHETLTLFSRRPASSEVSTTTKLRLFEERRLTSMFGQMPTYKGRPKTNTRKVHKMKTFTTGLLKGRITRRHLLAAVLPAAGGVSLAWAGQHHSRLGGAFIGSGGGFHWNAYQIPLDPAGRTAAVRVLAFTYGADFAKILTAFGADTATESTGQTEMISQDTAKMNFVGYGLKQGNPPLVCMITVMTGTVQFTGPDSILVKFTMDIYPGPANALGLPNADADGDGFPDPDTTPVYSIPGISPAKRVLP